MQDCFLMAIIPAKGILLINSDQKSLEQSHQETVTLWNGTIVTFFLLKKELTVDYIKKYQKH